MGRTRFTKRGNTVVEDQLLSEEDALLDDDIQEIRHVQWMNAEKTRIQKAIEEKMRLRELYYDWDGCRAHNRSYCRQCEHLANGGCPSYWVEFAHLDYDPW